MASQFAAVRVVRASGGAPALPDGSYGEAHAASGSGLSARPKSIYIAWVDYQRRAESMQRYFGYDLFYISSKHLSPVYKLIGYVLRATTTLRILRRERPDVVWLQLPPTFLVHLLVLFRFVTRRKMKIVADCHNAVLRSPWSVVPLSSRFLNRTNVVLVHNHDVVSVAHDLGVDGQRLSVLGDCVPTLPDGQDEVWPQPKPIIVMPCSFHADEPIEVVLQVARQLHSATFVITGNHMRIRNRTLLKAPAENVVFSGFLPLQEFDRLLTRASAVLCLTTQESIQLSAVSEAIAAGKPMIISDTKLLRNLFGHGGIFVDNTASSILEGCRTAIEHYGEYSAAARRMRAQRMKRWLEEAEPIRARLSPEPTV